MQRPVNRTLQRARSAPLQIPGSLAFFLAPKNR
jgi:hypothetical protein